jgi:adenylate cyclase
MRKKWLAINLASIFLVILHTVLFSGYFGDRLEPLLVDTWFRVRGPVAPPRGVVVVALDMESYKRLNISPYETWPRSLNAQLLDTLKVLGAKRVIFDLILAGKSASPEMDLMLSRSIASIPTVIAQDAWMYGEGDGKQTEIVKPEQLFISSAEAVGRASFPLDFGVVRRFGTSIRPEAELIRPLAQMASQSSEYPQERDFINFYGPAGTVSAIPFYTILEKEPKELESAIKDKIVFIGPYLTTHSRSLSKDSFTTPFYGRNTFGVEVHATATGNLLEKSWIHRYPLQNEIVIAGIIIFILAMSMFLMTPVKSFALLLCSSVTWGILSYALFLKSIFIPGILAFGVVLPLCFLISLLFYYITVYRVQQKTRLAFSRYVTPSMVDKIINANESIQLGGNEVEVTMLFTDIAGFTSWSEHADRSRLASNMNHYFSEIAGIALTLEGTLIKFIGDGMFVIWGAPIPIEDASDKALKTALAIQDKIKEREGTDRPLFKTRIGIHRDRVVVGNFGSYNRFDYTAIGDGVNITSRLEQLNKKFGTTILLSEAISKDLSIEDSCLVLGSVVLPGKKDPILVSIPSSSEINDLQKSDWRSCLQLFQDKKWDLAILQFLKIQDEVPILATVCSLYLKEIAELEKNGTPTGWRSEIVIDDKP